MTEAMRRRETREEASAGLVEALNEMFYVVLRVDPAEDRVTILQSCKRPDLVGIQMGWSYYLMLCGGIFRQQEQEKLMERLSAEALLQQAAAGNRRFTLELPYQKGHFSNWLTVTAQVKTLPGGHVCAYLFVRQSNEEHLLQSIIDLFVYSSCDYFIYLNLRENSYVMFSGDPNGTPLPPSVCSDYEAAVVAYAESFVPEEDREMVIREMGRRRVLEQLEKKGVHAFTTGVMEKQGYTRKRLEYRYYDREAQMVLLTRTDITDIYLEEQQRNEQLRMARIQAETDPLTGVLNYGGLHRQVTLALEQRQGEAALLFLDLDNFKAVNDSLGHQEGDALLRRVAQIVRTQLWEQDICGRVGGDEFVVFLPQLHGREQAVTCARRLCWCISRLDSGGDLTVSCSVGVAFAPEDGADYASLARQADRRAYIAKAKGKNQFFAG